MGRIDCSSESEWFNLLLEFRSLVYLCGWQDDRAWYEFDKACQKIGGNYDADANRVRWDRPDFDPAGRTYKSLLAELSTTGDASVEDTEDPGAVDALGAAQKRFGLITLGGKISVIDLAALNVRIGEGTAKGLEVLNRADGLLLIERFSRGEFTQVDSGKLANKFLKDSKTTMFSGVEFNPRGTSPGFLNLWIGPTIQPDNGFLCVYIKQLLHEVICGGREPEYHYLMGYLAHALQKPHEKPGVAVIMLGGKSTFARILQKIWSATFLHTNRIKAVVGEFNGSLERSYIVFLDEALFAGDKASAEALKSLVTEETIQINEKYQPSRQIRSFHRFFAASNAEFFKDTERDDRRDLVLRVSEVHKGNFDFWRNVNAEIDGGGVQRLIYELMRVDLRGFNVRKKPNTTEFEKQKLESLIGFARFWFDCLCRGELLVINDDAWPEFVSSKALISLFMESQKGTRTWKQFTSSNLGSELTKLCPSATKDQRRFGHRRDRGYSLPDLQTARKEFEHYIGNVIEWEL